jgi:hypothetical protein
MRVLLAVLASLAANTVYAAPDAVCPASRNALIADFAKVGQNKRLGELCRIAPPRIAKMVEGKMAALKPCLQQLGVSDAEVSAAMAKGAQAGESQFNFSGVKQQLCTATSEEFGS